MTVLNNVFHTLIVTLPCSNDRGNELIEACKDCYVGSTFN